MQYTQAHTGSHTPSSPQGLSLSVCVDRVVLILGVYGSPTNPINSKWITKRTGLFPMSFHLFNPASVLFLHHNYFRVRCALISWWTCVPQPDSRNSRAGIIHTAPLGCCSLFCQGHFYYKADGICILIHFFQFLRLNVVNMYQCKALTDLMKWVSHAWTFWSKAAEYSPPRSLLFLSSLPASSLSLALSPSLIKDMLKDRKRERLQWHAKFCQLVLSALL